MNKTARQHLIKICRRILKEGPISTCTGVCYNINSQLPDGIQSSDFGYQAVMVFAEGFPAWDYDKQRLLEDMSLGKWQQGNLKLRLRFVKYILQQLLTGREDYRLEYLDYEVEE